MNDPFRPVGRNGRAGDSERIIASKKLCHHQLDIHSGRKLLTRPGCLQDRPDHLSLRYNHAATDPVTNTVVNVSIWTDLDAARQMDTLAPMLAQRPILEQAGVQFDQIANYEPLWALRAPELEKALGSPDPFSE